MGKFNPEFAITCKKCGSDEDFSVFVNASREVILHCNECDKEEMILQEGLNGY